MHFTKKELTAHLAEPSYMPIKAEAWTTAKELFFIKYRLRKEAVAGYLKGCKKRKNWTGLDKIEIINAAERRLKYEHI